MDGNEGPGSFASPRGHERVVVARFGSRVMADLARSLLLDAGIAAVVAADDAGGLHPELPLVTGGVALAVPPADLALARSLLEGDGGLADGGPPDEGDPAGSVASTAGDPVGAGVARRRGRVWVAIGVILLAAGLSVLVLADLLSG